MMPEMMDDMSGVAAAVLPPVEEIDVATSGEACAAAPDRPVVPTEAEVAVARELAASARERGLARLLSSLTKTVVGAALGGEVAERLGCSEGETAGYNSGDSRTGTRTKTVVSGDCGPIEIEVPRDRNGMFEPQVVRERVRRLGGVDAIVLSLSARGLTAGEVSAHFVEVCGAPINDVHTVCLPVSQIPAAEPDPVPAPGEALVLGR